MRDKLVFGDNDEDLDEPSNSYDVFGFSQFMMLVMFDRPKLPSVT